MGGFSLFDLEKKLFHPYLCSKLRYSIEIWYAHSAQLVDIFYDGYNISASLHHLAILEM